MSKIQIAEMKNEYNNGIKPKDLMSKYNISKHALYHHVDKEKAVKTKEAVIEKTEIEKPNEQQLTQQLTQPVDPLIDFDLINNPKKQIKAVEPDFNMNLFENEDTMDMDLFNPNNLLKEEKQESKPEKFSLKQFFTKSKEVKKLTPEEEAKKEDEEQLKLVYQVRMYLYTFRDIDNLFSALNIENEDKKINKYIQDLYRKKKPELIKLLDFIKFNVRHSNNAVTSTFYSSIFFTIIKVLETIITRVGVDLTLLVQK